MWMSQPLHMCCRLAKRKWILAPVDMLYNKLGGYMMVWHMLYIPHVLSLLLVVKLAVAHMWPQLSSFVLHQSGRMM